MSTWLITGCSTGLGRAFARAALDRGENVVVTARDVTKVQDLADAYPDTALAVALDVTDDDQVTAAVRAAKERFGQVDVLVNNAGYGYRAAVEEGDDADVRRLFETHLYGSVRMIKAVLPAMRVRRSGTIVNLSSIGARIRALAYTDELWRDLTPDEITWRPHEESSAIGWHLGHQAHVAHFMIRNLTAAEPSPDPELDGLMDSANPEKFRGALPTVERLAAFRATVADRVRTRAGAIAAGQVRAPRQMTMVATQLLTALINHEYQHDQWIGEVRAQDLGHALPGDPPSPAVCRLDGYLVLEPLR